MIVIAHRCNFCSRQLNPADVWSYSSGQSICQQCIDKQRKMRDMLAGKIEYSCVECGAKPEVKVTQSLSTVRLYAVPKDGVYQFLCNPCKDAYCIKRRDIYGGTQFGKRLNID